MPIAALAAIVATTVSFRVAAPEESAEAARDCISTKNIDYTIALDERSILFFMRGHIAYRNALLDACPALLPQPPFGYGSRDSMLHVCRDTAITVFGPGSPTIPVATCRLGQFEPMSYDEAKALAAAATPPRKTKGGNRQQAVKTQPVELPQAPTPSDPAQPATAAPSTPAAPVTPAR